MYGWDKDSSLSETFINYGQQSLINIQIALSKIEVQ